MATMNDVIEYFKSATGLEWYPDPAKTTKSVMTGGTARTGMAAIRTASMAIAAPIDGAIMPRSLRLDQRRCVRAEMRVYIIRLR